MKFIGGINLFFDNKKYFIFYNSIISSRGEEIQVYKFNTELLDDNSLNNWALGLRYNYIEKDLLELAISGTGLTKKEYLEKMIFPNPEVSQGAATMSGEFGELLVYDYINYVLEYYVPRVRYFNKVNPDMPVPGSDVIGYKMENYNKGSKNDKLLVAEVKTRSTISGNKTTAITETITKAIQGASKDRVRVGESLNAEKSKLLTRGRFRESKIVERFQNKTDNPYNLDFFAVAVMDNELYSEQLILDVINNQNENIKFTNILIIHSKELKSFVRDLYKRACVC